MNDFYIGWSDGSKNSRKTTSKFYGLILLLMILLVSLFSLNEREFAESKYAYGTQVELEGLLISYPTHALQVAGGEIIPLVGYGKMGVDQILSNWIGKGTFEMRLRGTMIEYKGKKLMELSDGKEGVLEANDSNMIEGIKTAMGTIELVGEIIDPKCFFGVMKPGFGKVHKSCAIRCISGMIPPVFGVRKDGAFIEFYFLTETEKFNHDNLLSYVGVPITVTGEVFQLENWKAISLDSMGLKLSLDTNLTACASS